MKREVIRHYATRGLNLLRDCRRGNVTMTFALALIPMVGVIGAAVDYSRANSARTALQAALDATGLMLSKDAPSLTKPQLEAKALAAFQANFNHPEVKNLVLTSGFSSPQGGSFQLQLSATGSIDTTFAALWQPQLDIGASAQVVWGMKRLELALALDNTLSMASSNKMNQLKSAAKSLLKTLQSAAKKPDDVKVAVIPFATDVNVGTANVKENWIAWDDWEAEPANLQKKPNNWLSDVGPGSACPFTNNSHGYRCQQSPTNASIVSKVPSNGLICPSPNSDGTVYNGCYDSQEVTQVVATGGSASCGSLSDCSCTGSGSKKVCSQVTGYKHSWIKNDRSTWNGCVWDRDQSYDVNNTATNVSLKPTLYPAHQSKDCPVAMLPLTNSWSALNAKIDEMQPVGATNVTIGLQLAFQALSPVSPFSATAPKDDLDKVIILLTDGDNTANRWNPYPAASSKVDARTKLACANVKAANIKLYTVRVIDGNATLLKECASQADMYFDVQNVSQLSSVFSSIAQNLANLRLSK